MNKALSVGLIAAGVVLIIFGANESNSVGSSVTKAFTGNPTNHSMWLLGAGIVIGIVGLVMTFGFSRKG